MAKRHIIDEEEVKQMTVKMMVDSGGCRMVINEAIQEQLDLSFIEKRKAVLADGSVQEYDVVGPIHVKFKNRTAICSAMVLKEDSEEMPACRINKDLFQLLQKETISLPTVFSH